ncbi:MFS transporter [Nocardioides pacificus]
MSKHARHRAETTPALSRLQRWAALAVLSASLLVVSMDMTVLIVALPDLAADLAPTANQELWIVDVYSLVLAGLLVSMSALADRWGRKRMLLAGFVVFGAASALIGLADSPESVIAVRALLGVGGAMIMPTTLSLIRSIFSDAAERATALGIWAATSALGIAVGPIVGGLLLEHFSWHAAFLVNVPLMVVGVIAGLVILPEARDPDPGRWDYVAALLSIAGMTSLVWAVKRFGKEESLTDAAGWATTALAFVLLAWFVWRCLRRPDPLLEVRLFGRAPFTAGALAALTSMFAMVAALLLIAQWLQLVEGHSPLGAGVHLLPLAAGAAIASALAPAIAARIGARTTLAGGLAVAGLGLISLSFVPGDLTYGTVAVAMTLVGAGGGSLAIASAIIMASTPTAKAGNAAAIEETSYDLGTVLGVAVLGSIAAVTYRTQLDLSDLVTQGLDPALAAAAGESLGAATAIASSAGLPELAREATTAFTDALTQTGLIGGVAMVVVAVLVFGLVPRDFNLAEQRE